MRKDDGYFRINLGCTSVTERTSSIVIETAWLQKVQSSILFFVYVIAAHLLETAVLS